MNISHLRTFIVAQECLNFTKASQLLHLSQPAVSRQIGQLEEDVGAKLFERLGRSVFLTQAGKTLAQEAARLLADFERVAEAVRAHGTEKGGRLRVGASTTPGLYLLPYVLARLQEQLPETECDFVIENSNTIEDRICANELDLGVVGGATSRTEILANVVCDDRVVWAASASHPLARRKQIAPKELQKQTWIVREQGSATRRAMDRWLTSVGVEAGRTIEVRCPEAAKQLVSAGLGISCLSLHALDSLQHEQLSVLRVRGLKLTRPLCLIRHKDKHVSPAMEVFAQILSQQVQSRA